MTLQEPTRLMLRVAQDMRLRAAAEPHYYDGTPTPFNQALIARCRRWVPQGLELMATVIFTRDEGMHSSGWWKNPDYSRCEHLSLSFREIATGRPVDQQHDRARAWALAFYGERTRMLWIEPPFSKCGKRFDVYHYRLFMAEDWRTPIIPRKEVYSKEFTELNWKSWSEVHGVPDLHGELPP